MHDDCTQWRRPVGRTPAGTSGRNTIGPEIRAFVLAASVLLAHPTVHAAETSATSKSHPQHPAAAPGASSPAAKSRVSPYTIARRRQAEAARAAAQDGAAPRAEMRPAVVGSHRHSGSGRPQ